MTVARLPGGQPFAKVICQARQKDRAWQIYFAVKLNIQFTPYLSVQLPK